MKQHADDGAACCQGKHQPLQFLDISTLREYLRFEFQDLVGAPPEPPEELPAAEADEWSAHQQDPDSHLWSQTIPPPGLGAQSSMPTGDFDFERVLQDFVLLTFLVSSKVEPLAALCKHTVTPITRESALQCVDRASAFSSPSWLPVLTGQASLDLENLPSNWAEGTPGKQCLAGPNRSWDEL